jgi:hypothetical protein
MGYRDVPVHRGSAEPMANAATPIDSPGARAIIAEANRTDTTLPLFVAVGGGLSEVASAYLMDPSIGGKFTLVWIGGGAHPSGGSEYNFRLDPVAAQVVFNQSNIPIWQVPNATYLQAAVSMAELEAMCDNAGKPGQYLLELEMAWIEYRNTLAPGTIGGETLVLGDNPLILFTALANGTSTFEAATTPHVNADGTYVAQAAGRPLRIYKTLDTRLLFADFFAKMRDAYGAPRH